jgi:hypothetical protein
VLKDPSKVYLKANDIIAMMKLVDVEHLTLLQILFKE